MNNKLSHKPDDTVRILRPPPRVFTDQCDQNIWMGELEHLELELEQPVHTDPYNSIESARFW